MKYMQDGSEITMRNTCRCLPNRPIVFRLYIPFVTCLSTSQSRKTEKSSIFQELLHFNRRYVQDGTVKKEKCTNTPIVRRSCVPFCRTHLSTLQSYKTNKSATFYNDIKHYYTTIITITLTIKTNPETKYMVQTRKHKTPFNIT